MFPIKAVVGVFSLLSLPVSSAIFICCYQMVGVVIKLLKPISVVKSYTNKHDKEQTKKEVGVDS